MDKKLFIFEKKFSVIVIVFGIEEVTVVTVDDAVETVLAVDCVAWVGCSLCDTGVGCSLL